MRIKRLWLAWGLLTAAVGITVGWSVTALAAPPFPIFGRAEFHGYFTDIRDCQGHNVWTTGIPGNFTNSSQFISYVQGKLSSVWDQDRVGAAFIVQTMRGGVSRNNPPTPAEFADWAQRVQYAESQGWIQLNGAGQWNWPYTHNVNSLYQGPPGSTACGPNPVDDAYYPENGTDPAIIFRNPATGEFYYALRIECANPVGSLPGIPGLPAADYNVTVNVQPGVNLPPSGGIIQPGITYYMTPVISNAGPANTDFEAVDINNTAPAYISNAGTSTPDPRATAWGYLPAGCGVGPQCWFWHYSSIAAGGTISQTNGAAFQVNPATPEGTVVCFNAVASSSRRGGPPAYSPGFPNTLCYRVFKPHYPGIIGSSGDVHAGGNLCGTAPGGAGSIATHAANSSLTEYVLSASGAISNFGSNNAAGGVSATVGRTGNYYSVCQPDLLQKAIAFRSVGVEGVDYRTLPGGTYNVGALPAVPGGVYYFTGDVNLSGDFNSKKTLVVLSGTTTITNRIRLVGAPVVSGTNAPSMGVIAAGDIILNGAANQVDAYLFSNATINTCAEGNTPACVNTLTVNGFLMSRGILFRRLGPSAGGTATVGEQVNLTGQLYLNPPKFFDNAADTNLLQGQGERPPLN